MEPHILLAQLRTLLAGAPSFDNYSPTSSAHLAWLGHAHALISRWNRLEASSVRTATDFLGLPSMRAHNLGQIFGVIHRAIADLELRLPAPAGQAFGPGALYDFFTALRDVLRSAERQVLIVDPYVDASIFDTYLTAINKGVGVRVLVKRAAADLKAAADRFAAQHRSPLEVRASGAFHDRAVFVDGPVCWVMGQSIKDAARSMPTYLAPLSPDVAAEKLDAYESVWVAAAPI